MNLPSCRVLIALLSSLSEAALAGTGASLLDLARGELAADRVRNLTCVHDPSAKALGEASALQGASLTRALESWNSRWWASSSAPLRGIYLQLALEDSHRRGESEGAVAAAAKLRSLGTYDGEFWQGVTETLLVHQTRLGLMDQALGEFRRFPAYYKRADLADPSLDALAHLAQTLAGSPSPRHQQAAREIGAFLAQGLGEHPSGVQAWQALEDASCKDAETSGAAVQASPRLDLGWSLGEWKRTGVVPPLSLQQTPGDSPEDILSAMEFALDVRQPARCLELARRARRSSSRWDNRSQDRLGLALGRALNASGDPAAAAAQYGTLLRRTRDPATARTAQERQVLSWHYQGDYPRAAALAGAQPGKPAPNAGLRWRQVWSAYLGNLSSFEPLSKALLLKATLPKERARILYWQGRFAAKRGRTQQARERWTAVPQHPPSLYGVWADRELRGSPEPRRPGNCGTSPGRCSALQGVPPALGTIIQAGLGPWGYGPGTRGVFPLPRTAHEGTLALEARWYSRAARLGGKELPSQPFPSRAWALAYPLAFAPAACPIARELSLPEGLLFAVQRSESFYSPKRASPVGARGLVQLMPATARKAAEEAGIPVPSPGDLFDPALGLTLGGNYLRILLGWFGGSVPLTIAAYNGGPTAVARWMGQTPSLPVDEFLENIPFDETKGYTFAVLGDLAIYDALYLLGGTPADTFSPRSPLPPVPNGTEFF